MSTLKINLFGMPQIELNGRQINLKTHKALGLIAYLSITEKRQGRETLASLFWPHSQPSTASAALRTALWRINKSGLSEWLVIDRDSVGIRYSDNLFVDAIYFMKQLEKSNNHGHSPNVTCKQCISILEDIVKTYRTGFMQGYYIKGSREYEGWQTFQQDRMRFQLSGTIERLVQTHRRKGDLNQALIYAQHWVQIEPYDDEANRLLIQQYADAGQRDFAIRLYNEYTSLLKHDLNIMPDESVTRIYQQIKSGARRSHPYNRSSFTGLLFHVNFSSIGPSLSSTDEFYLEKLSGYINDLSKIIKNFGGKVFSSQLKSISALFFEGEPLNCALAIENAHNMEYREFSTGRSPGIVIHEIIDSNLLDLLDSPEYKRVGFMSQSAWEGQIIITPQVLATFDLPEGSQIIDFGYHTFEGIIEPIHMLGLIHPKF